MRLKVLLLPLVALVCEPAIAQLRVSVPIQYQGRWAKDCRGGFSLLVEKHAVGGLEIKGIIEDLPGHKVILSRGTVVTFFPQIGAGGRVAMVSFKAPGDKKASGSLMRLCEN